MAKQKFDIHGTVYSLRTRLYKWYAERVKMGCDKVNQFFATPLIIEFLFDLIT